MLPNSCRGLLLHLALVCGAGGRSWVVESYDGEAAAKKRKGGRGVVDSPPGRHRARSERCSATERREPALLVTQGRSEGGV